MQQERRNVHRTRVPGVHVTYESASEASEQADALDISSGGIFIPTTKPAPLGTRLAMEIRVGAAAPSWFALGRVVWTRETAGRARPSGMGVTLIDIDEALLDAIESAIASMAPEREKTVRGIGTPVPPVIASPKRSSRGRRRAGPAVLLVAAVVTMALSVMNDRIPWLRLRSLAAASPPVTTAPAIVAPSATPAPVSLPAVSATTSASPRATATASASKPPSRPAPSRSWMTTPRRPTSPPNDNPY